MTCSSCIRVFVLFMSIAVLVLAIAGADTRPMIITFWAYVVAYHTAGLIADMCEVNGNGKPTSVEPRLSAVPIPLKSPPHPSPTLRLHNCPECGDTPPFIVSNRPEKPVRAQCTRCLFTVEGSDKETVEDAWNTPRTEVKK